MKRKNAHMLESLSVVLLFALFALCAFGVLTAGLGVYRSAADGAAVNYERRTALSLIANQVRQHDAPGGVAATSFAGAQAVALYEEIDGTRYVTYLYCYDGALRELFCEEGLDLPPESGVALVSAQDLRVSEPVQGLLKISLVGTDGRTSETYLAARCGKGAQA